MKAKKTKWVFKTKRNNENQIVRYKARLVAKGYTQRACIDYNETYAPVVRYSSIRFLIALAINKGVQIHQMDAVCAFLQGDLSETIYLEQPEDFDVKSGRVCKQNRAIYGLKQSSRQWNLKLNSKLKKFNLAKSMMDPCIYYNVNCTLIVAIYVDEFLIFYKQQNDLDELRNMLTGNFMMKDMGPARGCIGMQITQLGNAIEIVDLLIAGT